jgi:hypothetical protein
MLIIIIICKLASLALTIIGFGGLNGGEHFFCDDEWNTEDTDCCVFDKKSNTLGGGRPIADGVKCTQVTLSVAAVPSMAPQKGIK